MKNEETTRPPLLILAGPTAVGKTALSLALAKAVGGEIVSADSVQVYRHMDIGSAKIRPDERQGVPHHLIDMLEPEEECNVIRFQAMAKDCIRDILRRGRVPILVGGTGFYIQAVLYDIDFAPESDAREIREELTRLSEEKGNRYLHELLQKADPAAAREIHENNSRRVIRALEFYRQTGKRISDHNAEQRLRSPAYDACYFVLSDRRERLYQKIDTRVDEMMRDGLLEEVRRLKERGCRRESPAMQALGYRELFAYLDGDTTLDEAVALLKRNTRRYAKRQLTWFRRERDVIWLEKPDFADQDDAILACMLAHAGRVLPASL